MQLSHYLKPQSVIVPLKATTKQEALQELVAALCQREGLSHREELLKSIEEREACATTFLPMGIAVPHARVADVEEIEMITGISAQGIVDAKSQIPIQAHIFFLFFSPTQEKEFGKHLKLLARIAAVFSDTELIHQIAEMTSPEEIFERIQRRERQIDKE